MERGFVPSPSLPSPPLPFPSLPSHSPLLPLPSPPLSSPPFLFLSLPRPYPFPPSPPLRSRTPCLRLGGLGERYKLPQRVRAEPGRQTLSGAFSAYLDAFCQAFSSNLSLVKLQLLTPPQFFQIFPFRNVMLRPRLTLSPLPIFHLTLPSPS